MTTKTFKWMLMSAASAGLLACGPLTAKKDLFQTIPVAVHKADLADRIIDEGEALFLPETFEKARVKFREALEISPENARGRFWSKLADFALEFHGALSRIEPAVRSFPDGDRRFAKLQAAATDTYQPNFLRYLRAPRPDSMHTPDELVDWIDRIRLRMSEFRKTVREIRDTEFSVTIPKGLMIGRTGSPREGCSLLHFGPVQFMPAGDLCFDEGSLTFGLSRLDFDSIMMWVAYNELTLDLWSAWRINPEAILGTLNKPVETKAEAEFFVKKLLSAGKDGGRRTPRPFASLREMSSEFLTAYRAVLDNQNEACPIGQFHPSSRRGYLLNMGICLSANRSGTDSGRLISMLEAIITGRTFENYDGLELNFDRLIEETPQNIKELLPLKLDKCQKLIGYNSKSFASFIPSIDRDKFFSLRDPCLEPGK